MSRIQGSGLLRATWPRVARNEINILLRLDDLKRHRVDVDGLFRKLETANLNVSLGQEIVINLTDLNDTAPVVTPGQSFSIGSLVAIDTKVGKVLATDADTTGSVTGFTITGGDPDGAFHIAPDDPTGQITVADNSNLAADSTYNLTVTATDGTNPSAAETVIINVSDNPGIWNNDNDDHGSNWNEVEWQ